MAETQDSRPEFSNIPSDVSEKMPPETRQYFAVREQLVRDAEDAANGKEVPPGSKRLDSFNPVAKGFEDADNQAKELRSALEFRNLTRENLPEAKARLSAEEAGYADMVRRTEATAARTGLPAPEVYFGAGDGSFTALKSAGDNNARILYQADAVLKLNAAERDFVAAHEVGHTTPENQKLLAMAAKQTAAGHPEEANKIKLQAEQLSDEFAIKRGGADPEAAKSALAKISAGNPARAAGGDGADHDHASDETRVETMRRYKKEMSPETPTPTAPEKPPAGIPEAQLGHLETISAALRKGMQGSEDTTLASAYVPNRAAGRGGIGA